MRKLALIGAALAMLAGRLAAQCTMIVCCSTEGALPRVAVTDTGTAFVIALNGLQAAIATSREPLRPEQLIFLSPGNYRDPAIASDGTNALVVWVESGILFTTRIGPDTFDFSRNVIAANVGAAAPAVAWNGSEYLIAWSHASNAILTSTVQRSGQPDGRITLVQRNGEQVPRTISIASAGDDSLLVWDRVLYDATCAFCSPLQAEVDSAFVDRDGHPRGGNSIVSATGNDPHVAWSGRDYFVIWTAFPNRGLLGSVMSPDGTTLESVKVSGAPDYQARIAWNGTSFYVIWLHQVFAEHQVFYASMDEHGVLGTQTSFAGRGVFDFDIASRPNRPVVLIRGQNSRFVSPPSACYLDTRRRGVRR